MRFNQESDPSYYSIRAYSEGQIDIKIPASIAQKDNTERALRLTQSFIMAPQQLLQNWQPSTVAELKNSHFEQILECKPEIILLGTGLRLEFPSPAITKAALENGIGVDIMDSSAACRTYNILMLEGRNVVLALILEK